MSGSIVITGADGLRLSDMAKFYSDVFGHAYQAPSPDGAYTGLRRAALVDNEIVGLMTGRLLADNDGSQRRLLHLYGVVRPSWRKRGIGGQLLDSVLEECRSAGGKVTVGASVAGEAEPSASRLLLSRGFGREPDMLHYARKLTEAPAPEKDSPLSVGVYRGGVPATDAAIVDLYHRAYRHRRAIPRLTEEKVREQLAAPHCAYLVVSDAGRLVGHATVHWNAAEYFVESVLIARSHWGSGAADALVRAVFRHALAESCSRIAGMVEATNSASRELCLRHGLSIASRMHRFSLNVG